MREATWRSALLSVAALGVAVALPGSARAAERASFGCLYTLNVEVRCMLDSRSMRDIHSILPLRSVYEQASAVYSRCWRGQLCS